MGLRVISLPPVHDADCSIVVECSMKSFPAAVVELQRPRGIIAKALESIIQSSKHSKRETNVHIFTSGCRLSRLLSVLSRRLQAFDTDRLQVRDSALRRAIRTRKNRKFK